MRRLLFALAVLFAVVATSFSDSPYPPEPIVFKSRHNSRDFFTMIPEVYDRDRKVTIKPAFGVAYRLEEDGKLTELYRTSGWYSHEVYLSRDGRHLVQMGPWNAGDRPEKDDLAVAFHKEGKLLKSYSTFELIKDPSKVEASVTHYEWLARSSMTNRLSGLANRLQPQLSSDDKFTLHTIDGWTYVFDVTTGAIVSTKRTKL